MTSVGAQYLTAGAVRKRLGGISDMTLWRWLRDPEVNFPQPLTVNRRRYFLAADIDAWERRGSHGAQPEAESLLQRIERLEARVAKLEGEQPR